MSNCYNMGQISNSGVVDSNRKTVCIGGIVSITDLNEGDDYKIENCYNSGKVIINNTQNEEVVIYAGNITGIHQAGTINNCYYEKNGVDGVGIHDIENCIDDITQLESSDMKNEKMIEKLNNEEKAYYYDGQNINNGYPILKWQYMNLLGVTSNIYEIKPKTTVNELKAKLLADEEIKIYYKNGIEIQESNLIGTGAKMKQGNEKTFIIAAMGDVDGDGEVKISDMTIINKHRLHKQTLKEEKLLAGDVTGDGVVDIKDLVKINKYRLHKISEL